MPVRNRFLKVLQDSCQIVPGSGIVVACSGGADSTALLALFHSVREQLSLDLQVAHFDHGLRLESGDDAAAVAAFATSLECPFHLQRCDVAAVAAAEKENLEAAGRRLRYEFLKQVATETGCAFIALGHHRGDQAETVLFRLLRGSGTTGLAGMAICRPPFIRPLLDFSREQLHAWLNEVGLSWREDGSNRDLSRTRNRLRHQILPLLAEVQSDAIEKLVGQAERSAIDEDFWQGEVAEWMQRHASSVDGRLELPLVPLAGLHTALRQRIWLAALRRTCPGRAGELATTHLEACDRLLKGRSQAGVQLPGLWVGRRYGTILLQEKPPEIAEEWLVEVTGPGVYCLPDGSRIEICLLDQPCGEGPHAVEFCSTQVSFPLQLRNRRDGDRFHPSGGPGCRKFKEFLIDAKVSLEERQAMPLVVAGQVLWAIGVRRCEGAAPGSGGKVLRIEFFRGDDQDKPLEKPELSC